MRSKMSNRHQSKNWFKDQFFDTEVVEIQKILDDSGWVKYDLGKLNGQV